MQAAVDLPAAERYRAKHVSFDGAGRARSAAAPTSTARGVARVRSGIGTERTAHVCHALGA